MARMQGLHWTVTPCTTITPPHSLDFYPTTRWTAIASLMIVISCYPFNDDCGLLSLSLMIVIFYHYLDCSTSDPTLSLPWSSHMAAIAQRPPSSIAAEEREDDLERPAK
mmetsp:Transcript_68390/g.121937  ORF Transcript_68390/g.121937 Transcript_68390/m.121937 type:complete len:109 (+) Transcript_68390:182-508(+)